jgi:hydrogenase maturation factor
VRADREGDHCITCSDEGVEMRVLEVAAADGLAMCVGPDGARSEVATELVDGVATGDVLLVHAGVALASVGGAAA